MSTHESQQPRLLLNQKLLATLSVTVLIAVVLMFLFAFTSVRGSDQYWYLADTEQLIENNSTETNTRFPGMILRQNNADPTTHFVHNGPLLWINSVIGTYSGAFNAWKITNFIFLTVTALATALAVTKLVSPKWGYFAFLLYILSPIAVWQSGNLLREPFYAFLTSLILLLFVNHKDVRYASIAVSMILFVGIMSHPMFLILAALYLLYLVYDKAGYVAIGFCFTAVVLALHNKGLWFPTSFQPGMKSIIASAIPGKTNMFWQLNDIPGEITSGLLLSKLTNAVYMQFFNLRLSPFYFLTNIGVVALFLLVFYDGKKNARFLLFSFLIFGIYAALVVLMQNQPRYQLIIAPVTVATLVLGASRLKWSKVREYLVILMLIVFFLVDIALANRIYTEGEFEKGVLTKISESFAVVPPDSKVAVVGTTTDAHISLVTLLKPRRTLLLDERFLSREKVQKTLDIYKPDVIVSERDPASLGYNGAEVLFELKDTGIYRDLSVFIPDHQGADGSQ